MTIRIDPEFRRFVPPLTIDEYHLLESSIINEGCRDALVVWQGAILDGHNRYEICLRHGIEFKTTEICLADREAAEDWIDQNQLGRRNLTPDQASILRGRRYNRVKRPEGRPEKLGKNCPVSGTTADQLAKEHGVSSRTIKNDGQIAAYLESHPEDYQAVLRGEKKLADVRREIKREAIIEKLENIKTQEAKAIDGVYDVIVIDPPWPMKKIERDVTPEQVEFDYPVMTEEEIAALEVPCAEDCHVFLWTTQKFLPIAFSILDGWGVRYVLTFVWHKTGGFQPYGLPQYNAEFVLYGRKGTPEFVDTKAFPTCFKAPRGKHSEKPDEFYNTIRRVARGRRLDMFSRRQIDGFDAWGLEANVDVGNK